MQDLDITEKTVRGNVLIVNKYGKGAFDINDNFVNVVIPFNAVVMKNHGTINTTKVTNTYGDGSGYESYQFNDTEDKVYLPTSAESTVFERAHSDKPQPTDYALCQGFFVS